jgi:uracil-DNA glycosylase family 4
MEGFFSKKQTESKSQVKGRRLSCESCGLYKDILTPRMEPFGNFKKGIMTIGEAPGMTEDKRGKQWQGKTGNLLKRTFEELGFDLFEDCVNINACNCRPVKPDGTNATPTNLQIDCCHKRVLDVIEKYKPKLIILLGGSALYSIIGHRWKKDLDTISKWRGWTIPDQELKCWVCPTFHPSYIERSESGVEEVIWKQDLENAFECLNKTFPVYKKPEIEVISDLSELEYTKLGSVKVKSTPHTIAFDYETTGLKPHAEGHRIICCSIADSEDHVYVFMMPEKRRELKPFINLLVDPQIKKVASNMKFEHVWTQVRLGVEVKGWYWDTMIASHILDNRPGITSIKFLTYVILGVVDYSSEVAPYLKADNEKCGNSINRIMDLLKSPELKGQLLKYNGYDSINEFRVAMWQEQQMLPF